MFSKKKKEEKNIIVLDKNISEIWQFDSKDDVTGHQMNAKTMKYSHVRVTCLLDYCLIPEFIPTNHNSTL